MSFPLDAKSALVGAPAVPVCATILYHLERDACLGSSDVPSPRQGADVEMPCLQAPRKNLPARPTRAGHSKTAAPPDFTVSAANLTLSNTQADPQLTSAAQPILPPATSASQPNLKLTAGNVQPKPQLTPSNVQPKSQLAPRDVQPKPQLTSDDVQLSAPQPAAVPLDAPDPIALKWAAKNPWFGTEMDMTYFAYEVHDQLIEEERVTADMPEYYTAISARVEAQFPDRFLPTGASALVGGQALPAAPVYRQSSRLGMGMYRQGSTIAAAVPSMYTQGSGLAEAKPGPTLYRQRSTLPVQTANSVGGNMPRLYKGSSTVAAMMLQQQLPIAPRLYRGSSSVAVQMQQPIGSNKANERPAVPSLSLPNRGNSQAMSNRQGSPRSNRGVGSLYDQRSGTPRLGLSVPATPESSKQVNSELALMMGQLADMA